jgi:hypothetical protein
MKSVVGIDPGKNGGIVIIYEDGKIETFFIPKIANKVDIRQLQEIFFTLFNSEKTFIIIEKVHALYKSSASATFSFGYTCGVIEGIVVGNNYRYSMVTPKEWQKEMFVGINPIYKKSKKKGKGALETKKMSEIVYRRLYPNLDLYKTEKGNKSKKVHDGLVDALLIATYAKRKNLHVF